MARQETDISTRDEGIVSSPHMVLIYTIIGFAIGLLFPVVSILADFQMKHIQFEFSKILYIHERTPMLYVIDLAPFVIAIIFNYFARRNRRQNEELEQMLSEKNEIFRKNSLIAKRIGEGDLYFDTSDIDQDDLLGRSLLIMKNNLVATSQREAEQAWIAKGKEIVGDILRQRNSINELAYETIINLIEFINAVQGAFYLYDDDKKTLVNIATYAYNRKKYITQEFQIGVGLVGQAAFERDIMSESLARYASSSLSLTVMDVGSSRLAFWPRKACMPSASECSARRRGSFTEKAASCTVPEVVCVCIMVFYIKKCGAIRLSG
ncbi:MAG: hypothetical protein J6T96_13790, partial [Bacteroidales bacterium]|nr:hypothetical protein [Bacteroidales bacterium]